MKHAHAFLAASAALLSACHGHGGGGAAPGSGTLALEATDAPFAHEIVVEATVEIDRISIAQTPGPAADLVRLYEGAPLSLDLNLLRDGLTAPLLERGMPDGTWRELRVHLVGARLVLVNGSVFQTSDGTLTLAPQDANGYAVAIDPAVDTPPGTAARLLLDFDLPRSFLPDVPADPLGSTSYVLAPRMRIADLDAAGAIRGLVTGPDGGGGTGPQDGATVYVLPAGETDPANALTSTASQAAGSYASLAVPAGVYDVLFVRGALSHTVAGVPVAAGATAVVDAELQ